MFYLNVCQCLPSSAHVQGMCSGQWALMMVRLSDRVASAALLHKNDPSPSTSSPSAVRSIPGQEKSCGRSAKIILNQQVRARHGTRAKEESWCAVPVTLKFRCFSSSFGACEFLAEAIRHSSYFSSRCFPFFIALLWMLSNSLIFFLHCGNQSCPQHSR